MSTKIVRFLYYILFLVTPLLVFSGTSELFEFNKMIFIYLITLIVAFVWTVNNIREGKPFYKKNILLFPMLIFIASQLLSTVFSIDVHTSIFGYYGRFNGGLLSIISYFTLFYIFIDVFEKKFLYKLLFLSVISSLLVIIWSLPGKFGYDLSCLVFTFPSHFEGSRGFLDAVGYSLNNNCWTDQFRPAERLFSTLGQPNWLGAYLSINFFIGLFFLLRKGSIKITKESIFYILYLLLNFTVIIFTRSQSSIAATIIGLVIFISFRLGIKKSAVLFVALIVLMFFYLSSRSKGNIVPNKYSTNVITDSFDIRKIVWKGAVEVGKSYLIFGTGVETFAYSYYFKRPLEHNLTSEWDFLYNKAHNEFLNYFATTGTIGLLAYLGMIGAVLLLFFKKIRHSGDDADRLLVISLFCAYVSILVTNFFGFSITVINLFFYIIPAFLIVLDSTPEKEKAVPKEIKSKKILKTLQIIAYSVVFIFALDFLIKYYVADLSYSASDSYYRAGDYKTASEYLNSALKLHYEHVYEDKLSYSLANLAYLAYYQKDNETSKTLVSLADYYNLKSIKASQKNVNYWKTRAKNYYLFFQIASNSDSLKKGIDALLTAEALAPTDPKIPYSLALYYSLFQNELKSTEEKNKYQELSLQSIDKSIRVKSNYEDAYLLKGQLLKEYGIDNETAK